MISSNSMKYTIAILYLAITLSVQAGTPPENFPFRNKNLPIEARVDDLIGRMTLEEKIDLLAGYKDFYLHPCERLGIPAFKMADGPLGIASWGLWGRATAFPSALSLAASWNKKLARQVGEIYAQEWRARGIHFMLAPGANIYRASKGARNFEYFGEDPYLTSEMLVPFIQAVQEGGVIATIKHFAGNDQEFDRYTVSTEMDERTLHEIYLPPFKAAVQRAGVKAVMTGYNPFRGTYCTENRHLIDILKKEWEFQGMLMSDWACTYSAVEAANNGLDIEMGSKDWFNREKLLPLIQEGKITEEVINDKIKRIYGPCIEMGFFDRPQQRTDIPVFNPEANRMALQQAEEGIILLKNEHNTLPLKHPRVIAMIGPTANPALISDRAYNTNGIVYGGGGSSRVHPWYVINDLQGIRNEFPDATLYYTEGISNQFKRNLFQNSVFRTANGEKGLTARYYTCSSDSSLQLSGKLLRQQALAAGRSIDASAPAVSGSKSIGDLILNRVERYINNEWWGLPHHKKELGTDYRIEWDGYIDVTHTDSLRFFVDAQGGYRLWLDGKLLIDASRSQSFDMRHIAVAAQKGESRHVRLEYLNQRCFPAEIRMGYTYDSLLDFSEARRLAAKADVVICCLGLDGSIELEGRDRPFELPFGQNRLVQELTAVNPNTVVVLHAGGGVDMASWIDRVPAVVHALYSGQEGGNALARILSGKVNPSAKLPFTIERRWADSPAAGNYDETRKEKKIYYREGIFTGYRGYEWKNIRPLFPFGYGLSYTTFAYSDLQVQVNDKKKKEVTVSFRVTNTGPREGKEITQLYIRDTESKEQRPLKELKGFDKIELKPGETKTVTLQLNKEHFQYFSKKKNEWTFEPGEFKILVGASSQDIRLEQNLKL